MSFVADYELIEWLAPGNHGDWWLARTPPRLLASESSLDAEHVALKALWLDATDLDFDRMVRELRILNHVSSPHLVHLIEAGESQGRLFYVRPHYGDGTLADLAPGDPLVFRALADAARGAHALHRDGLAHRDIKPTTVNLDAGRGVLGELGLAQQIRPGLTTGIGPVGAIEYIAPEIALGERGSPQSDVWALGVVLHRVFTGHSVYGDRVIDNVVEGYRRVAEGNWQLHSSLDTFPEVSAVISRCLGHLPTQRFVTAEELAVALDLLADQNESGRTM